MSMNSQDHGSAGWPSSAATGSRSPAPTPPTPTRPTRTCSPRRIDGLVTRFDLAGERLGEVVAGAVLKHTRDFNLTREAVLGSQAVARDARPPTSSRRAAPASRP